MPQFYEDFLNKPNGAQQRPHHQRVLDGGLRRPVRRRADAFGPYQLPGKSYQYAMEASQEPGRACPAGRRPCNKNIRTDGRAAWVADVGAASRATLDFVFYLTAGQDESVDLAGVRPDEVHRPRRT